MPIDRRPPSPPFPASHLSPLTLDIAIQARVLQDYAFGGATTCNVPGVAATVPNLSRQISLYLASAPSATADESSAIGLPPPTDTVANGSCSPLRPVPPQAAVNSTVCRPAGRLYVVFIGPNDFYSLPDSQLADPLVLQTTVGRVLSCRVAALDRLMAALTPSPAAPAAAASAAAATAATTKTTTTTTKPISTPTTTSTHAQNNVSETKETSNGSSSGSGSASVNLNSCSARDRIVEPAARAPLRAAVAAHNAALEASLAPLRLRYPDGPALEVYDVNRAVAIQLAVAPLVLDTTTPCLRNFRDTSGTVLERAIRVATTAQRSDVCSNPNEKVWYDGIHPTSVNGHLQALALPFLVSQGWI
ncbi:hypothetical protein VOLCADRAFT_90939 [Volvox carteri f. nagariensis]|uniref:Uncharacterized protein n=1 Tax=Volvox carteri f. nagariensis TaxID=3068 RepID=D8TVS3_VOLCA|nr:uncharacterized protein VOLCADRAFT_90939 [Volvox carteri f. nagariensis]EFJ48353.1 hypothetical protein VOLCADRAFT_90939 [Volvox carteri f. nagariensis]|eukprot:XP_002950607.1 hypothetical protein VOLCADRAFT_90939 [Volvox carteri f. nagariensis]